MYRGNSLEEKGAQRRSKRKEEAEKGSKNKAERRQRRGSKKIQKRGPCGRSQGSAAPLAHYRCSHGSYPLFAVLQLSRRQPRNNFRIVTTKANADRERIIRDTYHPTKFVSENFADHYKVLVNVEQESSNIAQAVHGYLTERPEEIGVGDQGHMFRHAMDGTFELMPLNHVLLTKHDLSEATAICLKPRAQYPSRLVTSDQPRERGQWTSYSLSGRNEGPRILEERQLPKSKQPRSVPN